MSSYRYGKPKPSAPTILLAWLAGIAVTVVVSYSVYRLGVMIDTPIYASLANSSPGRILISPGRVLILVGVLLGIRIGSYLGGVVLSGKSRGTFFSDVLLWLPALLVFFAVFVAVSQHMINGRYITGGDALWLSLVCLFTGLVVASGTLVVVVEASQHFSDWKRRRREKEQANQRNRQPVAKLSPTLEEALAAKRRQREEQIEKIARAARKAQAQSLATHADITQAAADFDAALRKAEKQGVRFSARERLRINAIRESLRDELWRCHVEKQEEEVGRLKQKLRKKGV